MNQQSFDLLICDAQVVLPDCIVQADVGCVDGRISSIGELHNCTATESIHASGLHLLPGVIDSQVHFREPGLTNKEDLESGTRSAVLGGVTAIMEMPNTNPATINQEALSYKVQSATNTAWCDFAFFIGGHIPAEVVDWHALETLPGACGIKIFMGSSTGHLLVAEDDAIETILRNAQRRIAIHAEDEMRLLERNTHRRTGDPSSHPVWRDEQTALLATKRILALAKKTGKRVHVLHVTTQDELPLLQQYKQWATMEVTPQHLTLDASMYETKGSYMQMNPPVRKKEHQDALWKAVKTGLVDVIGSDHAPHLHEEKTKAYPESPSGMPGVQTMLPVMLTHVHAGKLSLLRMIDLLCSAPTRVYNIANKGRIALGLDADFALVDLQKQYTIRSEDMAYKCGWTPFDGMQVCGKVIGTIVRGTPVMLHGELRTKNARPLVFGDALPQG